MCGSAGATACTATGNAQFDQLTTDGSKYSIYLTGDGVVTNSKYTVYVLATCTTAVTDAAKLAEVTSPFIMFNGFRVSGISTDFIADGTVTGKTAVKGMFLAVFDKDSTLVGCTNATMS